ncbi:MAG: hypothetical protein N3A66_08190 [Planctomycetota bacterium]|nr:hypothetical protein [Planctomycetota bacterium]
MIASASPTMFLRWQRRAWAASWALASAAHLAAAAVLFFLTAGLTQTPRLAVLPGPAPLPEIRPFHLVEPPAADIGTPMPPAHARAWLRFAHRDRQGEKAEKLAADLESLLAAASGISDASLAEIGAVLGHKPGTYVPRAYYLDEVNPNANLPRAAVVRASAFVAAQGEAGYTIALQDKEKDEFVFRLTGQAARELAAGGLAFGDKILAAGKDIFDLKAARLVDVRRWLVERGEIKGYIIVLEDAQGRSRLCHIPGQENTPWQAISLLFARRPDGTFLHDPEDETTPLPQFFDHATGSLYRVTEAPARQEGVKRARVELLDAKGERLIFFVEGEQAEEMLARTAVLERHPALRRIFEQTGAAGIIWQMQNGEPPTPGE